MDQHLSRDDMARLFSYGATAAEVAHGTAHIVDCPTCWTFASEIVASLKRTNGLVPGKRGRPSEERFKDAREALIFLMEIQELRSIRWLKAKAWWAELKELSPQEQAAKVNTVAAVHQREVVETIIREARLVCGRDPHSAEHLAMTAHRLADHLLSGEFGWPKTLWPS